MADEKMKRLIDYLKPVPLTPSIVPPPAENASFEIKPSLITLVQNNHFSGLPHEDPYLHLSTFLDICNVSRVDGLCREGVRLRLFPFSLTGKARKWLYYLPGGSITNWDQVCELFLTKYVPQFRLHATNQNVNGHISSARLSSDQPNLALGRVIF